MAPGNGDCDAKTDVVKSACAVMGRIDLQSQTALTKLVRRGVGGGKRFRLGTSEREIDKMRASATSERQAEFHFDGSSLLTAVRNTAIQLANN